MIRRTFLQKLSAGAVLGTSALATLPQRVLWAAASDTGDLSVPKDWLGRWEKNILGDARIRYCDKEMGEEIGWMISPFLNGFYYGYLATHDVRWVERLVDWNEAWIQRAVKDPDGAPGWPKSESGGAVAKELYTDSLLGEAMGLRPAVLMADVILKTPALKERFGAKADSWLNLAEQVFHKWDARACWRELPDRQGGLWVVPDFGIDRATGKWTDGYARRATTGFSNPANKQNHIARWLLAMYDVTKKPIYRERAELWWRLMKSRMKTRDNGKFYVWNYWDPAGPWDFKPDGSTRHWVGVHPNGGYYQIDVEGIVAAHEHGLVFTKQDLARLIATNRDFMWNQQVTGAKFQRIDGGLPDARWKNSPGALWTALVPHDPTLRRVFLANHNPESWGGMATTPWFLATESAGRPKTLN